MTYVTALTVACLAGACGPLISDSGSSDGGASTTDGGTSTPDGSTDGLGCSPVRQDCPGAKKCIIAPQPGRPGGLCVDGDLGGATHLAGCASERACAPGFACVRTSTANDPRCEKVCDPDEHRADCADLGFSASYDCLGLIVDTRWGYCRLLGASCSPYADAASSPCTASEACRPVRDSEGEIALRCAPAGRAEVGESCSGDAPCKGGLACTTAASGGSATCVQYCQENRECPGVQECKGQVVEPAFHYCVD